MAHPPVPRDHSFQLPKRVRALALKILLSAKHGSGQLVVLHELGLTEPKTAQLHRLLASSGLGLDVGRQKALIVHGDFPDGQLLQRAAANIPGVQATPAAKLTVHDLTAHPLLLLTLPALAVLERRLAGERRHALLRPPMLLLPAGAAGDGAAAVLGTVGADGLSRVLARPLPAGLERMALAEEAEVLPWARIDLRSHRLVAQEAGASQAASS